MTKLYLSDIIIGIDNTTHDLSLGAITLEFEKLSKIIKELKKENKHLIGEIHTLKNHKIYRYDIKEIVAEINSKEAKGYMLSILTKQQYITNDELMPFSFNNINYNSSVIEECYDNNGIFISLILNNHLTNRIPLHTKYIHILHQMNYEYIKKVIRLNDSFYISRLYIDMLNSGYNLYFHTGAYNDFCKKVPDSHANMLESKIKIILKQNFFENIDSDIIKRERGNIFAIRNNNPMLRIYFVKNGNNIYFLEITNNHNDKNIAEKLNSAVRRYAERTNLKDLFDIEDDKYLKKVNIS